jgi:hypothetical protein
MKVKQTDLQNDLPLMHDRWFILNKLGHVLLLTLASLGLLYF